LEHAWLHAVMHNIDRTNFRACSSTGTCTSNRKRLRLGRHAYHSATNSFPRGGSVASGAVG
jgi:hypothetical protein